MFGKGRSATGKGREIMVVFMSTLDPTGHYTETVSAAVCWVFVIPGMLCAFHTQDFSSPSEWKTHTLETREST